MKTPSTMEGALSNTWLMKRTTFASGLFLPYSESHVPAKTPTGIEKTIHQKVSMREPTMAFRSPPPELLGPGVSERKILQFRNRRPWVTRSLITQKRKKTPNAVHRIAKPIIIRLTRSRLAYIPPSSPSDLFSGLTLLEVD